MSSRNLPGGKGRPALKADNLAAICEPIVYKMWPSLPVTGIALLYLPFLLLRRKAVPYLRRLVPGFPPRRPGFEPRLDHVGFVVDKVAVGQVFS
jgi:hypothetical protein